VGNARDLQNSDAIDVLAVKIGEEVFLRIERHCVIVILWGGGLLKALRHYYDVF
jgi:hypothetical protein